MTDMDRNNAYRMATGALAALLATTALLPADATANPFGRIGKLIDRVEAKAEDVERRAVQIENTVDSVERAADAVGLTDRPEGEVWIEDGVDADMNPTDLGTTDMAAEDDEFWGPAPQDDMIPEARD